MTTTTNAGQCQNGGTWLGTHCKCPDGYEGTYCQYAKETIELKDVTVNATVEMKAKIDNRNFTEDLKNKTSAAYRDFEKEFKEQMRKVYERLEGYQDVEIHELTNGSILVNYTVLLKVLVSATVNATVETISQNLVKAINNNTFCNSSCVGADCDFCFNSNFTNITSYEVNGVESSLCDNYIVEELKPYYTLLITNTSVFCVSVCDKRSPDPHNCVHGKCIVMLSGPQCECSDQSAFWYQDSMCSSRISKIGVAVGVPVTVLVVTIAIFTVLLVRAKRQKDDYRLS
ncbi:mucin-3A-like [Chroicocephalus ridibundus]|uniref:mucin-3A-like n=1 Tax=Chroicocephalus ridibundus TaxID=1192867 RepID=UPI002FDDA1F1